MKSNKTVTWNTYYYKEKRTSSRIFLCSPCQNVLPMPHLRRHCRCLRIIAVIVNRRSSVIKVIGLVPPANHCNHCHRLSRRHHLSSGVIRLVHNRCRHFNGKDGRWFLTENSGNATICCNMSPIGFTGLVHMYILRHKTYHTQGFLARERLLSRNGHSSGLQTRHFDSSIFL